MKVWEGFKESQESGPEVLDHCNVLDTGRNRLIYIDGQDLRSVNLEGEDDALLFKLPEDRIAIGQNCISPDGQPLGRTYSVSENWSQAAVVTQHHKLGIWLDPTECARPRDYRAFGDMLFDLEADPFELQNIAGGPGSQEAERLLRETLSESVARVPATGKEVLVARAKKGRG